MPCIQLVLQEVSGDGGFHMADIARVKCSACCCFSNVLCAACLNSLCSAGSQMPAAAGSLESIGKNGTGCGGGGGKDKTVVLSVKLSTQQLLQSFP